MKMSVRNTGKIAIRTLVGLQISSILEKKIVFSCKNSHKNIWKIPVEKLLNASLEEKLGESLWAFMEQSLWNFWRLHWTTEGLLGVNIREEFQRELIERSLEKFKKKNLYWIPEVFPTKICGENSKETMKWSRRNLWSPDWIDKM